MTNLDCGVPKLHGHGALDQPRQLPERRGDLGGRRRRQLHLPVLDERRPSRGGVRCERGIENAMSIIENVPHCTRVFIRLGSDKTLIFVHLMANIIREKSLNKKNFTVKFALKSPQPSIKCAFSRQHQYSRKFDPY